MFSPSSRYQSRTFEYRVSVTDADFIEGFKLRDPECTKVVLGWIDEALLRLRWTYSLSRKDIAAQASMKLVEIVSRPGQPPIRSPKGLVYYVVKCAAVDAMRDVKRAKAISGHLRHRPSPNPNPEEILLSAEQIAIYLAAREAADAPCRELWDMMLRDRLTYKEMAGKLHTAEGTLRVRHKRCIEKAVEWIRKNS